MIEELGIRKPVINSSRHQHIHSYHEKSIIERTIKYLKDRTECFNDYFSCRENNCKLENVIEWLNLFAYMYNKMIRM